MTSGLSSASRPWFTLKTADDDLMEADGVRAWLSAVERRIYAFWHRPISMARPRPAMARWACSAPKPA
jgi:hypothetical protein